MNKYSKRALKTTATVGMSLAMVLSAAAPVMAAEYAPKGICKDITVTATPADAVKECGVKAYQAIISKLDGAKFSTVTLESDMKIAGKDGRELNLLAAIEEYKTELIAAIPANSDWTNTVNSNINLWVDTVGVLVTSVGSLKNDEVATNSDLGLLITELEIGGNYYTIGTDAVLASAQDDLGILKTLRKDYGKYLGTDTEFAYAMNEAYDTLNGNINDYLGINADTDMKNFVLGFDAVLQNDLKEKNTNLFNPVEKGSSVTIASATDYTANVGTTDLQAAKLNNEKELKKRITNIKDHSNYDRFKDSDEVINIIDAYQELIDGITENKDVLKSESFIDYTKTKVAVNGSTTKKTLQLTLKAVGDILPASKSDADKADMVAESLNRRQFEILKAVKEDVIDYIYTMESKQVGKYFTDKSNYTSTSTNAQRNAFDNEFADFLTALVDKEEGLFAYDVIANHMADFEKAMAAATKDIEKMTPANIKATDKATLVAAEDAIYELTASKGKFIGNVTSTEEKALRTASTKIENLRVAFDALGTTSAAGWYDMGNGNWGYNNVDGTPAAYKWVASGSNWYFVKDGKMARNTWLAANSTDWYYLGSDGKMATSVSVDGCWINSLGIYKK